FVGTRKSVCSQGAQFIDPGIENSLDLRCLLGSERKFALKGIHRINIPGFRHAAFAGLRLAHANADASAGEAADDHQDDEEQNDLLARGHGNHSRSFMESAIAGSSAESFESDKFIAALATGNTAATPIARHVSFHHRRKVDAVGALRRKATIRLAK